MDVDIPGDGDDVSELLKLFEVGVMGLVDDVVVGGVGAGFGSADFNSAMTSSRCKL